VIITVTSGSKGGTGRSTVAYGLSVILSMYGIQHGLYDATCIDGPCSGVVMYLNQLGLRQGVVRFVDDIDPGSNVIIDLPPMSVVDPRFSEFMGISDLVVLVTSHEPDSVVAVDRVLEAYPSIRYVRLCNKVPLNQCEHYLKYSPEHPAFVVGEPSNFRVLMEIVDRLDIAKNPSFRRINRETTVNRTRTRVVSCWDPYCIIGIYLLNKYYYAAVPVTSDLGNLVMKLMEIFRENYLNKLGISYDKLVEKYRKYRKP
jgi:hypothetical protein